MQTYYIAIPFVLLSVFLFVMWRDMRTIKSRMIEIVEQHNNVKKALDRHDTMLMSGPVPAMLNDLTFEPIDNDPIEEEDPSTPTVTKPQRETPPPAPTKAKVKPTKASSVREKDA